MSILAMMAVAGTLACADSDVSARCSILVEVSGRRTHRLSCAGLLPIEKLYSVDVEGRLVCLPLASITAGSATARLPDVTLNQPAQQPSSSPTPRREPNSATPEPQP